MRADPHRAVAVDVHGAHAVAGQAVGRIRRMAEVAQPAGRRFEQVEAVAGAHPDAAAPVMRMACTVGALRPLGWPSR